MRRPLASLLLSAICLLAAGCDQLGIESASTLAARKEADGKAVGGACRHAGRAIEDCYALNRRADRAAVYAGWREMNEYMLENKLEPVLPQIEPERQLAARSLEAEESSADEGRSDNKATARAAGGKATDKAADKGGEPAAPRKRTSP